MSKGNKGRKRKKRAEPTPRADPDSLTKDNIPKQTDEAAHREKESVLKEKTDPIVGTAAAFPELPLPFFGRSDWFAFLATSFVTFIVYLSTMGPNVTLEDSGELATASMYAGVPHAPGYPLWTVYSWLFTVLLPIGNIAWRVTVSSAVAASLACGLVALMASRGGRLMLANMDWFGGLEDRWRSAIGTAAGFAGGTILGFTGFMWSQAVIVEVYTLSSLTFTGVFACLMRWWFVPSKRWPLYLAYFLFGLCLANHQTLLLAAVGIELLVFLRHREIGRDFFLCNSIIYLYGLTHMASGSTLESNNAFQAANMVGSAGKILMFAVYNVVGIGSMLLTIWHTLPQIKTKHQYHAAFYLGFAYTLVFVLLAFCWSTLIGVIEGPITKEMIGSLARSSEAVWHLGTALKIGFSGTGKIVFFFCVMLALGAIGLLLFLSIQSDNKSTRSKFASSFLIIFMLFAAFWMVNLLDARHRLPNQAELQQLNDPTLANAITVNLQTKYASFIKTAKINYEDANSWTWWFAFFNFFFLGGLLIHSWARNIWKKGVFSHWWPLLCTRAATIAGIACYLYMPLTSLTNPPMNWAYPRTADNLKYAIVRGQYDNPSKEAVDSFSRFALDCNENGIPDGGQVGVFIDETLQEFNPAYILLALLPFGLLIRMRSREMRWLAGMGVIFVSMTALMIAFRNISGGESNRHLNKVFFEAPHLFIGLGLGLGLALALGLIASQWDKYRRPLLAGAGILLGLELIGWAPSQTAISATPTSALFTFLNYDAGVLRAAAITGVLLMGAFCALLALPKRKPLTWFLVICCLLPARHGLANWWDNELRGHMFGYWYGHNMFKPPFKDDNDKPMYPPMEQGAVLFGGTDAGRFNPTYMIFCESQIAPHHRTDPDFDRRDVYIITQNALAEGQYMQYIRAHYNRSKQIDSPLLYSALASFNKNDDFKQKYITPTEKALKQNEGDLRAVQMELQNIQRDTAALLKKLGINLPKSSLGDQQLNRMISNIVERLKGDQQGQIRIKQMFDEVARLRLMQGTFATNSMMFQQNLSVLTSAHNLLNSVTTANKWVAPLDDWLTLKGRNIEKQRRSGESLFTPKDFKALPDFANLLIKKESLLTDFLSNQLSEETLALLQSPTDPKLPSRLAADLNQVLESEWNNQMFLYSKLRELDRSELTLLNEVLTKLDDKNQTDTQIARNLLLSIQAISQRQMDINIMLVYARAPTPSQRISLTSLRSGVLSLDKQIQKLYSQLEPYLGGNLPVLNRISSERTHSLKNLSVPFLYKENRFNDVTLSRRSRSLLHQNPYTEARISLNRMLLEDAFPNFLRKSSQSVYPAEEIHLPSIEEHQAIANKMLSGKNLASSDMIWVLNGGISQFIFNKNPNRAFYLEESVPLQWMNPYLVPYGIIMKFESFNEISSATIASGNGGKGFKVGEKLKMIIPFESSLTSPRRDAIFEVATIDDNGGITSLHIKDNGNYEKLPPQPVLLKGEGNSSAKAYINHNRLPSYPDELPLDILSRDRNFWQQYAERLVGSHVVRPEAKIDKLCDWARKTYLRRNHTGHTPAQRQFLRDYVAQRNFATLRLSVARVYRWRARTLTSKIEQLKLLPTPERAKVKEQIESFSNMKDALLAEADFAFRQAISFGATHPVATGNYLEFLLDNGRTADARLIVNLAYEMDPNEDLLEANLQRLMRISAYKFFIDGNVKAGNEVIEAIRDTAPRQLTQNPGLENCVMINNNLKSKQFDVISDFIADSRLNRRLDSSTIQIFAGIIKSHLMEAYQRENTQDIISLINLHKQLDPRLLVIDKDLRNAQATFDLPRLEQKYKNNPSDITNTIQLLFIYQALNRTNDSHRIASELLNNDQPTPLSIAAAARAFDDAGDLPSKKSANLKMVDLQPSMPSAWYDLALTLNRLKNTNESLNALEKAWILAGQTNDKREKMDIRYFIRTTNSINNLRQLPKFKAIIKGAQTKAESNSTNSP